MRVESEEAYPLGALLALVVLVMTGLFLNFYHLSRPDLNTEAAAQLAVNARQMALSGDWVDTGAGQPPEMAGAPLPIWSVRLAGGLSSQIEAFDVRFPSALSGLLLALVIGVWFYLHARRYGREDMVAAPSEGFALLAGLMVLASPVGLLAARSGSPESMFALFYMGAAFCLGESLEARRSFYAGRPWRFWLLWGYVLAGFAMLAFSPLALLLLWTSYGLAARSYRLRGLDWSHALGLVLAFLIAGTWASLYASRHPEPTGAILRTWLFSGMGHGLLTMDSVLDFISRIVLGVFPWNVVAVIMIVRVWLKKDRSPTLVFWMCSALTHFAVMILFGAHVGWHALPLAAFLILMATDGVFRWNFENAWSSWLRGLLRVLLLLLMGAGIFLAVLLSSDVGLTLFILLAVGWLVWAAWARREQIEYTPWQTIVRQVAITLLLIIAAEGMLLADWVPRQRLHNDVLAFFNRAEQWHGRSEDSRFYVLSGSRPALHDYYLPRRPSTVNSPDTLDQWTEPDSYWFEPGAATVSATAERPFLIPITRAYSPDTASSLGRFGLIKTVGPQPDPAARVALLGNTGTRKRAVDEVGERFKKFLYHQPVGDALLLGNNLWGPAVFDHLNFIDSFEEPFSHALKDGVAFHAALGHEDQAYAWLHVHYPGFNMNGRRYYQRTIAGGLIDIMILDSERLYRKGAWDEQQLAWLEESLAASNTPWKVVGLFRALESAEMENRHLREGMGEHLLPILRQYGVDLVAWSSGGYYERLEHAEGRMVLLNVGWSGGTKEAEFGDNPALARSHDQDAGLVMLTASSDRLEIEAITVDGDVIDTFALQRTDP